MCIPFGLIVLFLFLSSEFGFSNGQTKEMEGKVVGGDYVKINQFPHAVFLEMINSNNVAVVCGSSILNQIVLITVAHCFDSMNRGTKILAYAGHENIKKARMVRRGAKIITHKSYNRRTAVNDVALVILNKRLQLGNNVKRIIIRRGYTSIKSGLLAGWGLIREYPEQETVYLKSVTQPLQRRTICSILHLDAGMFCAGSTSKHGARPAPGDSGSGLVSTNFELIGLLSYKVAKYPALPVYMNATYYLPWIKQNLRSVC